MYQDFNKVQRGVTPRNLLSGALGIAAKYTPGNTSHALVRANAAAQKHAPVIKRNNRSSARVSSLDGTCVI